MCAMHYGSCGYRCLAAAAFALTNMTCPNRIKLPASAFRADKALWKTFSKQITPTSILCCEPFPELFECDLQCPGHHKHLVPLRCFYSTPFAVHLFGLVVYILGFADLSRYAYILIDYGCPRIVIFLSSCIKMGIKTPPTFRRAVWCGYCLSILSYKGLYFSGA